MIVNNDLIYCKFCRCFQQLISLQNGGHLKIRKADIDDAKIIHKLSWQLGYSPSLEIVKSNIEMMLTLSDYDLVVAIDESNQVIGWMSLAIRHRIEDIPFLQVAALVTDESVRGKGAGKLLMNYAANSAQKRHLSFVGLHSSNLRAEAHAFYEHLGYSKTKESFFFRKDLNCGRKDEQVES